MTVQAEPIDWPPTREAWEAHRPELYERFARDIYGRQPTAEVAASTELLTEKSLPDGGVRRQVALHLDTDRGRWTGVVLVDLPPTDPAAPNATVPAFLGLNFRGNHASTDDPDVWRIEEHDPAQVGRIYYDEAGPSERDMNGRRWDFDAARARGYAVVTCCYIQAGPDDATIFEHGLYPLLADGSLTSRPIEAPGAISLWAWLLSRILDQLGTGPFDRIDPGRVCVMGHSRLGKTSLWASACDPRFAAVISNNSGAMGAALSRPVGETALVLAHVRPYWFSRHFSNVVGAGRPLPLDQPELIALSAPRPAYVASATEDFWADPAGELLSLAQAAQVWGLEGDPGISGDLPAPDGRLHRDDSVLAYHLRDGTHDVRSFDWAQWLDWADRTWGRPA